MGHHRVLVAGAGLPESFYSASPRQVVSAFCSAAARFATEFRRPVELLQSYVNRRASLLLHLNRAICLGDVCCTVLSGRFVIATFCRDPRHPWNSGEFGVSEVAN